MLRTSSQEGGLQQRTESPKATSGAPNGFVRPVAVASIFRPALGGGTVDGNPDLPEKRRLSAAKESKVFGSSLSSEEFSRRRQSFGATNVNLLGQNVLKQTSGISESLPEQVSEISTNVNCSGNSEESSVAIQNAVVTKFKDDDLLTETSSAVIKSSVAAKREALNKEEKEKNSKNISHDKPAKRNKISSFPPGSDSVKVASISDGTAPVIQNGIPEDSDIPVVAVRPRSRNAGVAECSQNSATPQAERRRRNKFSVSPCIDKESASQTSCALGSTKDSVISSGNVEVTRVRSNRISSEAASKNESVTVAECVKQSSTDSERRRRNKTSQDASVEQNRNVSDTQVGEKDLSSQNEAGCNLASKEGSSAAQTKCESHLKISDEKRDSVEALDTQSVSKFRTYRRTSDIIAAKIQTIFSKSDKPSTLSPSSSKLNSYKDKSVTGKEPKSEICSSEKSILSQESTEQKVSEEKHLDRKENVSCGNSSNTVVHSVQLSRDDSQLSKTDCANVKKQQSVKGFEKVETYTIIENKLKNTSKNRSETGSSVYNSHNSTSASLNNEKSVVRSRVEKDNKFNSGPKSLDSTTSLTARSTISNSTDSEKQSVGLGAAPQGAENTAITKKEVSSTKKELTSNSLSVKEEKTTTAAVPKKPVTSINFLITEVSVQNSPQPQRISTGKVSPRLIVKKETSQSVEQKNFDTQKSDAKKCVNDGSEVKNFTAKSEIINCEATVSKCADKNKVGKTWLLKEENKVSSASQQQKSGPVQKSIAEENNTSSDTKTANVTKSELVNSKALTLKSSEKDKTHKATLSKEENKVPPGNSLQKSSQAQNSGAVKYISGDTKAQSCISSEFQELKSTEKDKTGKLLSLKEGNKVVPENILQKSCQTQKASAKVNTSSDAKAQNSAVSSELVNSRFPVLKPPEKDKIGKNSQLKEWNKLTSINAQQKSSQLQKSGPETNTSSDIKAESSTGSRELVSSESRPLKAIEKDKTDKTLPSTEGNKVESESLRLKSNKVQKSGAAGNLTGDTKAQNFPNSDTVNAGVRVSKPLGKDKIGQYLPPKEDNKVTSENLSEKTCQIQKSGAEENSGNDTKSQSSTRSEFANSGTQVLKPSEKNKVDKSLLLKEGKASSENLKQKNSQVQKLVSGSNAVCDAKAERCTSSEVVCSMSEVLKPSEKDKINQGTPLKESKVVPENLNKKSYVFEKWRAKENASGALKVQNVSANNAPVVSNDVLSQKQSDNAASKVLSQKNESEMPSENVKPKFSILKKLSTDDSTTENITCNIESVNPSQINNNNKDLSVEVKTKSLNSEEAKIHDSDQQSKEEKFFSKVKKCLKKEQKPDEAAKCSDVKKMISTVKKTVSPAAVAEHLHTEGTAPPPSKSMQASRSVEIAQVAVSSQSSTTERSEKQESGESLIKEAKYSSMQSRDSPGPKVGSTQKELSGPKVGSALKDLSGPKVGPTQKELSGPKVGSALKELSGPKVGPTQKDLSGPKVGPTLKELSGPKVGSTEKDFSGSKVGPTQKEISLGSANDEFSVRRDTLETSVSGQITSSSDGKQRYTVNSVSPIEDTSKTKRSTCLVSSKREVKESAKVTQENSCFRTKMQEISEESRDASRVTSLREKDSDDSGAFTSSDSALNNPEFPGRISFPFSKFETPRPPERKRSGYLRETFMSPPPRVPLRSISRTGSLKRPDDSRLSVERSLSILRSSSHSVLGPPYTPQRISYTEMLSKLGTCGLNPSLSATSNRKFGTSQVSELWADLGEEQSNIAHTSEMLESETSERMRLEKEVQELQSRYSHIQQKSDKMEMEMMEARVFRATEVNGDISEDEENDATVSIYKQKYERTVRDMEIMKRRLQQQHEEEVEQSLMLKKAADKRLSEALEDVEEERQVVNQWKRKTQKLGAELQDLRLMLEEQMARNGELEKKQRRFDAELSTAQEEIRKEHQFREKLTREKDQAQLEKYSLEQELQATRLDMDMQHEKIALLNRELDELSVSSKGEEEVTQLKRAKQELERKTRDQEEELEELAGQVQLLEQSKLRLEMSLEKLRQEHRRESSVRDEEIEEIRASSSKKIKNLEAQLENEQEERHQLVKQKHELERRIIELSDQPAPQDPEIERRLRRDLKRTKALLRDAHAMLEHMRDGQTNKTLIRQLKNQLEDAEFTKSVAIKARQSAELELQESQSQLEEVTNTKNDVESRCLQLSREKSALQTQLEEMEEEMAEIMKKYKASVAQMSIDQKSLAEQNQQISELETERLALKDQLADVSSKLDHISGQTEDSARVHRLDAKVRDLESKLELEQTTRSRLEHQIARLKEQSDRSREECDSLRSKELQAQEGTRRLQRQLRELREDYAALQQKESEAYRKQHELEMALENTEADLQVTKNDLRLACQRIQDLQTVLEDDLDSGTDVPDDSGSDTDSSLDVSVLGRQCLTPLQRSDSISSNTSIGSEGRQFRTLSHSQDMAFFSRMMQKRTSMDFLI